MSQAASKGKAKTNNSSPAKQKAASRPDRQLPLVVLFKGAALSCIGPNVGEKRWEQVCCSYSSGPSHPVYACTAFPPRHCRLLIGCCCQVSDLLALPLQNELLDTVYWVSHTRP